MKTLNSIEKKQNKEPYSETVMGEVTIFPALSPLEKEFLNMFLDKYHFRSNYSIDQGIYDFYKPTSHNDTVTNKDKLLGDQQFFIIFQKAVENVSTDILMKDKLTPSFSCPLAVSINSNDYNTDRLILKNKHPDKTNIANWLVFLIEHFFKKDCIAKTLYPEKFNFLEEHNLNGVIFQKINIMMNSQKIEVKNNEVNVFTADLSEYKQKETSKDSNNSNYKNTIQEIVQNSNFNFNFKAELQKSDLLNKLIFAANLRHSLKINNNKLKNTKI